MNTKWVIFYSDGRTIDNTQKSPYDLAGVSERAGVQVIVQPSQDGKSWVTTCRDHNYVWDYDRWMGVNDTGLLLYLLKPGAKCVIFGETIDNETYSKIFNRAVEMCGEKTTFERRERRP